MSESRVLVVTGGGTGIGAATVRRAAADGWTVVACGRRQAPLDVVAEQPGVEGLVADASTPDGIESLVSAVLERHGRIDGVVANAGIMRVGSVVQTSNEDWDDALRVNLTGPFLLAKATVPHLIASGGSFVGISSIAAIQVPGESVAYAVSKAGLSMLVRTIARDFAADGVRANVVCPGWVRTEMADQEMAELGEVIGADVEDSYRQVTSLVPQGRPGTADEIANAVVWLLGTESSYVNGSVITVDGGTTIVDAGTIPYDFAVHRRSSSDH